MSEVLAKVEEIFRDVFEDDELVVSVATKSEDIEEWDSMMHVGLILGVERAFGIRFTSAEVASLKNVGELIDTVERHKKS